MRIARILRPGVTALAVGSLLLTLQTPPERRDTTTPRFDDPGAAARSDLARRQPPEGRLDLPRSYEAAARHVASLSRFSSAIGRDIPAAQPASRLWLSGSRVMPLRDTSSATGVLDAWTPLGPGNVGGRTRVVKFHPLVPTTLFAAGVSGGIWTSDDNGTNWRPTGDGLTSIAVNSLLIDPARPDVMYAGTGEGYLREEIRGTGLPLRGSGIYVTTDGARSWQQLPGTNTPDFHWVNDLEFGVNDSRRIYAATRSGVWRSTDRGATWVRLLAVDVRGGCLDLALRPDRSEDVLFASCGSFEQATVYRFPRAADRSDVDVVLREANMGRTSLAIAPSDPEVIYALAASNGEGWNGTSRQGLLAVYRSGRGGAAGTWEARVTNADPTQLNTLILTNVAAASVRTCTGSPTAQNSFATMGWYSNVIGVDPRDPNRVWAAGVEWFRSDDGGRTWGLASFGYGSRTGSWYAHADQHAIAFHPDYDGDSNQIALIGNDGGVFRTSNARALTATGASAPCGGGSAIAVAWSSLNRGYGVTQFYHGTPFPDGTQYLGGTQDNGTLLGSDAAGPDGWKLAFGGDGGFSAVHPTQPGTWLMEYQWANLGRTTNGGGTISQSRIGLDPIQANNLGPEANYLFIPPFTHDPRTDNIWLGGNYLYRGPSFGLTWQKVGAAMPEAGRISAIAVSPRTAGTLAIGSDKGHISRVSDGGAAVATSFNTPRSGWVTSLAFDPLDDNVLYATYGNFGGAHVFRSIDNGETWRSLDGSGPTGLPDIPVHSIVVDPDDRQRLYLGTDLGVMVSIDGGQSWMREETGFGPAVTMWLSLIRTPAGQKQLFAFTHGRGAWRVRLR